MSKSRSEPGILFVHEGAARNGAAMSLLHFSRWFKANSSRPFSLVFALGGEIEKEFQDLAPTWADERCHWFPGGLRAQAMRAIDLGSLAQRAERAELRKFASSARPALIYLNGFAATNFRLVEMLDLRVPMLAHVHGLGLMFRKEAGSAMPRMLSASRRFIACSEAVKENLIHHEVASDKVEVVHESIAVGNVRASRSRVDVLRELRFPDDAFLVVGCGLTSWNKGADVFLELARHVYSQRNRAHFAWLGPPTAWDIEELKHDAMMAGLADKIRFTGSVVKTADYFAAADVFALPSREDSFPLACLEAAALGKPIVCFADAGGMPEFVEDDCGFVVPYLDIESMANRVITLLDCADSRTKMGIAARRKVTERHDVSVAAPRIMEIIEKTIQEG